MGDELIRDAAARRPVPNFGPTPWVTPPALSTARVAIVTTAGSRRADDAPQPGGDPSFRLLTDASNLVLGNESRNYDRSGWLYDPNVVFPLDRLKELAVDRQIGSVASCHIAFVGNNHHDQTLTSIRLDSGPAAAAQLRKDGVDVVLLTPV